MTNWAWCVANEVRVQVQVKVSGLVRVRRATLVDVPGVAQVHVQSWQATYPGILPAAEIERHTLARRVAMWTRALSAPAAGMAMFIAVRANEVQGFASTGPFRVEKPQAAEPCSDEGRADGELNALYLLPSAQRQGIGRRLFDAAAQDLRQAGFGAMRCWVLHGNPAVAFYENIGGVRAASKTFAVAGAMVVEHCYRFDLD